MPEIIAFAVVSLALQVGGGFMKLLNFWGTVRDAPDAVNDIVMDLQLLSRILSEFVKDSSPSPQVMDVLKYCNKKIDVCLPRWTTLSCCWETVFTTLNNLISKDLQSMAREFEPNFNSNKQHVRLWGKFKAANKTRKLNRVRSSLQETKMTLLLGLLPQL
jgi:hypothetical protein